MPTHTNIHIYTHTYGNFPALKVSHFSLGQVEGAGGQGKQACDGHHLRVYCGASQHAICRELM